MLQAMLMNMRLELDPTLYILKALQKARAGKLNWSYLAVVRLLQGCCGLQATLWISAAVDTHLHWHVDSGPGKPGKGESHNDTSLKFACQLKHI